MMIFGIKNYILKTVKNDEISPKAKKFSKNKKIAQKKRILCKMCWSCPG
jgi:hypothetical protein